MPSAPADSLTQPANSVDTTSTQTTASTPRVPIETDRLSGSISLLGGRIDDLNLNDYRVALDDSASVVTLLSPVGSTNAHYALYGWAPAAGLDPAAVPGPNTKWALVGGQTLSAGAPVTLQWSNGQGQTFNREIAVDEDFLFSITQSVTNTGGAAVNMAPYGLIARHGEPQDLKNFSILHEGVVATVRVISCGGPAPPRVGRHGLVRIVANGVGRVRVKRHVGWRAQRNRLVRHSGL